AWDMAEAILMSRTGFDGQVVNEYIPVSNWDMVKAMLMSRPGFDGQNGPI
ncbi:unnamed protein product, partial [Cylindrotheca closterium]